MRILLLVLAMSISLAGSAQAACPQGDQEPNISFGRYPDVPADKVFGPFAKKKDDDEGRRTELDNAGEDLELSKPGDKDGTEIFYILIDRVNYSDGTHPRRGYIDAWPPEAASLLRARPWMSTATTPTTGKQVTPHPAPKIRKIAGIIMGGGKT